MIVYQLVALPTEDTLQYLSQVFDACPVDLNLKGFHVEINSSVEPMEADPSRLYKATAGMMDRFYDSVTGDTSLILPLRSMDLQERCAEVRVNAPSAFYGSMYFPFMVIKDNLPTMKRHRRGLMQSYADILVANHRPLLFEAELVIEKEYESVPYFDYYMTQAAGRIGV